MKRYWIGALAFAAAGCNNIEVGLLPLHLPMPDFDPTQGCTVSPTGDAILNLRLDTSKMGSMGIFVVVRNSLSGVEQVLQDMPFESLPVPNSVRPLRFDFRWECDSTGFSADLGPLVLPAFSPDGRRPFCFDKRDETTRSFTGFDVVSATGRTIQPNEEQIVETRPVPPQLGRAFRDLFRLANLAEACCADVGGCANVPTDADPTSGACGELQSHFDSIAGRNVLSVRNVEDVSRWRAYSFYTGLHAGMAQIPSYFMRLRGTFEGVTPTGDLVTSSELTQDVGLCDGCLHPDNPVVRCMSY